MSGDFADAMRRLYGRLICADVARSSSIVDASQALVIS
jgi:hypothetical protein